MVYMPMCGISHCPTDYRLARNPSPEYVFEYIVKGEGEFNIDGHPFEPQAGGIYIVDYNITPKAHQF